MDGMNHVLSLRSLLSAVKKLCWFVSIREIRVSFGSGYAGLGFQISGPAVSKVIHTAPVTNIPLLCPVTFWYVPQDD